MLIRFRVITDVSVRDDGWYIDDVAITGGTGYQLCRKNGDTLFFDKDGRLSGTEDRNGNRLTYAYAGEMLSSATGPYGRTLAFANDGVRITGITDSMGRSFSFVYDENGNLAMITNPSGKSRNFYYDADHNLIRKSDASGRVSQYEYDSHDRLISATDAEGNTRNIFYDAPGVTTFADPAGNRTEFLYNDSFNVTRKTDALGNITEYVWDDDMNRIRVSDASGTVSYTYDDAGNRLSKTDRLGNRSDYTYDVFGNVLTITDADGHITTNTYDDKGNLLTTTDPAQRTVSYEYDGYGNIVRKTDAGNRMTTYIYDTTGNLISVTGPDSFATTMEYDATDRMVARKEPNNAITRFKYDLSNQMTKMTDAIGSETAYTYDADGNRTSVTDANGNTTSYEYDGRGNLTEITDALGNTTTYTYTFGGCSACGSGGGELLASVSDANGNTLFYEYDALGRRTREIDPLGNSVTYTYDAVGNILTKTDANGHVTMYAYDPLSRLTEMTDPAQGKTRYAYDIHSLLTGLTDPGGNTTAYEYDAVGQALRTVSPDAGETLYEYYPDGNPKSETDARGITLTYYYDEAGRLVRTAFPDPAEDILRTYDSPDSENGEARLTNIADASGTTYYHYDILGRIVREIRTAGDVTYATAYEYDNIGNLKSVTYPNGRIISYSYDVLNRPAGVTMTTPEGESVILAESFAYDPAGNLLSFVSGNGLTRTQSYDVANRITAIIVPGAMEYDYAYDPAGNITGMTDRLNPGLSKSYAYDEADRLASASGSWGNLTWTYDANSNRLTQSDGTANHAYTYGANRLTSVSDRETVRNYQYDAKGSIIDDGVHEFAYNQKSRLVRASEDGAVSGEYLYNSFGQRVVRNTGEETTIFLYDQQGNLIAEADESGEIVSEYIWLGGTLLAAVRKSVSAVEATVDFDPDTLNLTSNKGRWVTCYIELPEEYDVAEILCDTVMLNGVVSCEKSDIGDYDKDGIPDMMVKFDRDHVASLLEPADEVVITVDGMAGGVRFVGTDVIRVIDEGTTKEKKAKTPVLAYAGSAPDNAETTVVYYFHCDHLGTPQAVTDENGNVVWKADYKPFGETEIVVSEVGNDFRFPGQYYDVETGLHYNWHRYYDAGTGRYLRSDPIGLEGGMNLFAYAKNNPVSFIDPKGLEWLSCWGNCIDKNAPKIWEIIFGSAIPKKLAPPFRVVRKDQPLTTPLSVVAHYLNKVTPKKQKKIARMISKKLRHTGRVVSRIATPLTIAEGIWAWCVIGYCAGKCGKDPCQD